MIMIECLFSIIIIGFITYEIFNNHIRDKKNKNIMKYKELKEAHLNNKKSIDETGSPIETRIDKDKDSSVNKDPLSRAEILGFQGETEIAKILNKIPGESRTLSNLYIPAGYDKLTEVDLVYICNHGIYVIESKNFSGFVRGSDNYKYWVQYLNGKEYKFFSPVLQNENHVRYINKLIPKYAKYVQSLVVFGENCKMSIESGSNVISAYELYDFMENNKGGRAAINNSQIQKIYEILSTYENVSDFVKDKHKRRIQSFKHKL